MVPVLMLFQRQMESRQDYYCAKSVLKVCEMDRTHRINRVNRTEVKHLFSKERGNQLANQAVRKTD